MELVEGQNFTELLTDKRLPLNKFMEYSVALADALTGAHRKGITHRDLKPDNLMLGEDGRVKVLDFGLAKIADGGLMQESAQTVTQEGTILGTVAYMAPEQAEGKPADTRSDIFLAGCDPVPDDHVPEPVPGRHDDLDHHVDPARHAAAGDLGRSSRCRATSAASSSAVSRRTPRSATRRRRTCATTCRASARRWNRARRT